MIDDLLQSRQPGGRPNSLAQLITSIPSFTGNDTSTPSCRPLGMVQLSNARGAGYRALAGFNPGYYQIRIRTDRCQTTSPVIQITKLINGVAGNMRIRVTPGDLPFEPAFATARVGGGYLYWSDIEPYPVTHDEARDYCSSRYGSGARLPTRDEFEALSKARDSAQPLKHELGSFYTRTDFNVDGYKNFDEVTYSVLWSSTELNPNTRSFFDGSTGLVSCENRNNLGNVICIRLAAWVCGLARSTLVAGARYVRALNTRATRVELRQLHYQWHGRTLGRLARAGARCAYPISIECLPLPRSALGCIGEGTAVEGLGRHKIIYIKLWENFFNFNDCDKLRVCCLPRFQALVCKNALHV